MHAQLQLIPPQRVWHDMHQLLYSLGSKLQDSTTLSQYGVFHYYC